MHVIRILTCCFLLTSFLGLGACGTAETHSDREAAHDPPIAKCGGEPCDPATQYCLHVVYQADCESMKEHVCVDLPKKCGDAPSCGCIPQGTCDFGDPGEAECDDQGDLIRACSDNIC